MQIMERDFIKATNAVYKILDFLPGPSAGGDPLKNKAKSKALEILELLTLVFGRSDTGPAGTGSDPAGDFGTGSDLARDWISLKKYLSVEIRANAKKAIENIGILKNYLEIARGQEWISSMNFLIISKEYDDLKMNRAKFYLYQYYLLVL